MKLSEIQSTLREIRVSPVKTLGQNFLHDQNISRRIVEQAEVAADDYVVEIGPGLGALTEVALASGARVLGIEKDARLVEFLRGRFRTDRFEVIHADALAFDVRTLFAQPRVKLIGNLPYNIASQLLLKYLEYPSPISLWLFMLQKEMAERFSAQPSTKDYGALTLQIQFHCQVKYLRTVRASVFIPKPEVDSAIILAKPRDPSEIPGCDYRLFVELVRLGFSQRRKQLGKLLREVIADWDSAAASLALDPKTRAEALSLAQWVALTNFVRPEPIPDRKKLDAEWFPVVDRSDTVLHSAQRRQVHGDNLRHRAVHILIFNDLGEVFLQKRSRWKDRHPLQWDSSAAGHVNAGEGYDVAAARELEEELGIRVGLQKITKLPASERTGQEFIWLYRGQHDGDFRLDRGEIETGKFFPTDLITAWISARPGDFAPGFIECWKAYRAGAVAISASS
ncbi:MAG: 16S rRNA (adenine(1518)-N(6)/adenine(1519)-N(6))-dimethyltransferase RsmA [Spartobacteria bacterium]